MKRGAAIASFLACSTASRLAFADYKGGDDTGAGLVLLFVLGGLVLGGGLLAFIVVRGAQVMFRKRHDTPPEDQVPPARIHRDS